MEFYRYVSVTYTLSGIILEKYKMIKETPCGWWIVNEYGFKYNRDFTDKKWVSKTARKRFAYPTKEEALFNFEKRKDCQIKILKARLNKAETDRRRVDYLREVL